MYKDIEAFVPETNVFICPNGIEKTNVESKPVIRPVEAPVKILFLSNLIESKGVFVLLDACSILHKKGFDFVCDFVGAEGDLNTAQFNERVNQLQLAGHVNYLGKKFGSEKQDILANADIFAFPTYYSKECFPLVLLEAMSEGLPLISTYEGGIPDIIEEGVNGFLIPQQDATLLAGKLEMLITNPGLCLKMGNAGILKFKREFNLEIFERRIVEIIVNKNNYMNKV
ncbi:MAG: glycosyltransferase family 4 protein [Paludibacter sp.]|nr:glycosyltransferase family 4 protein [Paludibacter sp.]